MIEIYYKSIRDESFKLIDNFKVGSWIHVDKVSQEDLDQIVNLSGLEKTDLQDCFDKFESPRIEEKEGNIIIFLRHPQEAERGMHTTTLAIVLTKNFIITISPHDSPIVDKIINSKTPLTTTQKSKLLLFILLRITQEFTAKIQLMSTQVMNQEKKMQNINNKSIVQLTKNEDTLNQYLSSLVPLRNLLESITTGRFVNLYEKDHDLLQDLLIAIKQSEDLCAVNVKNIRSLRDSYQILFTNDVNKTIKFLTAITIILTVPTIISSIYGMNVRLPLENSPSAFIILLNIIIITSLLLLFVFSKKKWL